MADLIFETIKTLVSVGSLIVSIIVFVNTIRKTEKERRIDSEKNRFHSFLNKIDEYLQLLNPQIYYDNYAIIYGENEFSYEEKFSEIKHINSKIYYMSQEIQLYNLDGNRVSMIIIELLKYLETESTYINDTFCKDIGYFITKNLSSIEFEIITQVLENFNEEYMEIVKLIFRGMHLLQENMLSKIDYHQFEKEYDDLKNKLGKELLEYGKN